MRYISGSVNIDSLFYLNNLILVKQLYFIFFIVSFSYSFAQPKNDFSGLYKGNKKNMYNEFEFLGNGYVKVNQSNLGEYFHENDSVYVLIGNDAVMFSIQKNKLKGISEWIKNDELKRVNPKTGNNTLVFQDYQRAELLKKYYKNNYQNRIYSSTEDESILDHINKLDKVNADLCTEGLDLGCIRNYSYLTVLMEHQIGDELEKTFQKLYQLSNRVIELNNVDGYGLLFTYYLLKDETQNAEKYLEIGLEKGSQLCLQLAMEKYKE